MKKVLILIFCLILFSNLNAKNDKTDFSLKGGLYGNINLYQTDFEYFNVYRMYHSGFSSALGVEFAVMLGGEYDINKDLFGFDTKYSFELLYSGLNANLKNKDLLGYDIGIGDYDEIYADYVIEPSIKAIITEHTLKTYFLQDLPMSIKSGFFLGLPLSPSFSQYTELLSPEDVKFENGSRIANEYNGDIPDAASIIFGLTFGVGYDFEYGDNFIFTPELKFNYGLSNISSQVDWKINTLQAGISINYNIPKPQVTPPARPPMPVAPITSPPPAEAIADINIQIFDDKEIHDNKIHYNYTVSEYFQKELVIPIIFINDNVEGYGDKYEPEEMIKLTADKLKNENSKLTIAAGIENESDKIQLERIIEELKNNGIDETQIVVNTESIADKKFKYPELKAEAKAIKFKFDNGDDILSKKHKFETKVNYNDKEINIKIDVSKIENYKLNSYANIGKERIELKEGNNTINLKKYFVPEKETNIFISAIVSDEWNNEFKEEKSITIVPSKSVNTFPNYNTDNNTSTYTIGFFDFDSEEIYGVDNSLKSAINEAVKNKRQIKLIALTDNLGIDSYNKRLALRRADTALKELGLDKSQVQIDVKEGGLHNNSTPYGRMLNRSVIIEIK